MAELSDTSRLIAALDCSPSVVRAASSLGFVRTYASAAELALPATDIVLASEASLRAVASATQQAWRRDQPGLVVTLVAPPGARELCDRLGADCSFDPDSDPAQLPSLLEGALRARRERSAGRRDPRQRAVVVCAKAGSPLAELAAGALAAEGIRALPARSAAQALTLCRKVELQLLLIDADMVCPVELLAAARRFDPHLLAVVCRSSFDPARAREELAVDGVFELLHAPLAADRLAAVVRAAWACWYLHRGGRGRAGSGCLRVCCIGAPAWVATVSAALRVHGVEAGPTAEEPDAVLLALSAGHGLGELRRAREQHIARPLFVLDPGGNADREVCLALGADDYQRGEVLEPGAVERLRAAVSRRRAQACVEEQVRARYEVARNWMALLERNADAIVIVGEGKRVSSANAAARRMFKARGELVGSPFPVPPDAGSAREIRLPGGRCGEMRCADISFEGRPAVMASIRDISARKQLEQELRAVNERLERELERRAAAEVEIKAVNERLERKVQHRTEELRRANSELEGEVDGRRRAETALQQALQRVARRARQLQTLTVAVVELSAAPNVQAVVEHGARAACEVIGSRVALVHFAGHGGDWTFAVTGAAFAQAGAGAAATEDSAKGQPEVADRPEPARRESLPVCRENAPLRLEGAALDPYRERLGKGVYAPRQRWLGVPLVARDGANIGLLEVIDKLEGELSDEDSAMMSQLALALQADLQLRVAKGRLEGASRRLAASNRELTQFAYVASHDLKAPLRAIANLADWIEEDWRAGETSELEENLGLMRSRVRRMTKLLDDLLEYSRAGRRLDQVDEIACEALLDEIIALLSPRPGLTVVVERPMPVLRSPVAPLRQVLMNLIGNALKHHGGDGHVWVSAEESDDRVSFTVRDDGPGIEPEFHERVFEMFKKLQSKDKVEGSGIGLALVRKIVEAAGGRIELASRPGEGASFTFSWPRSWPAPLGGR